MGIFDDYSEMHFAYGPPPVKFKSSENMIENFKSYVKFSRRFLNHVKQYKDMGFQRMIELIEAYWVTQDLENATYQGKSLSKYSKKRQKEVIDAAKSRIEKLEE